MICSGGATLVAVVLFALAGQGHSDSKLRLLGAGSGAALALAAVAFGLCRRDNGVRWDEDASLSIAPRFFLERRRTPRQATRTPVRFAVDGRSCEAVVLSVSASGALLRLRGAAGRELQARIGDVVRLDGFPAGRLARIGNHGVYVDFAVQYDTGGGEAAGQGVQPESQLTSSST